MGGTKTCICTSGILQHAVTQRPFSASLHFQHLLPSPSALPFSTSSPAPGCTLPSRHLSPRSRAIPLLRKPKVWCKLKELPTREKKKSFCQLKLKIPHTSFLSREGCNDTEEHKKRGDLSSALAGLTLQCLTTPQEYTAYS